MTTEIRRYNVKVRLQHTCDFVPAAAMVAAAMDKD